MNITNKILQVDMDGVLVDIEAGVKSTKEHFEKYGTTSISPDEFYDMVDFSSLKPIPNAIEAIKFLSQFFDIHIASTAPWDQPKAWKDKREWIGTHLPELKKKLTLTHRKDLLLGDYLVDDRTVNGASNFSGEFIQFGTEKYPNWEQIVYYLLQKEDIKCLRCAQVCFYLTPNNLFCKSCLIRLNQ